MYCMLYISYHILYTTHYMYWISIFFFFKFIRVHFIAIQIPQIDKILLLMIFGCDTYNEGKYNLTTQVLLLVASTAASSKYCC
jgi:hypothetical protein